jgi:hypothetical protein
MRVARLHRVIARFYVHALQAAELTQPQLGVLTILISAAGPVRPAALAARLMLDRSTISRNLALMQKRGWGARDAGWPTGLVLLDGGRDSEQGAGYRLVAASDGCRTRTVICVRSLKPSFS